MPVLLGKCANCKCFLVVDDEAELAHVKVKAGRKPAVHTVDIIEMFNVKDPHIAASYIFQVLDTQSQGVKVRLKNDDFPEQLRNYLELEGNRKR